MSSYSNSSHGPGQTPLSPKQRLTVSGALDSLQETIGLEGWFALATGC